MLPITFKFFNAIVIYFTIMSLTVWRIQNYVSLIEFFITTLY